jgi:TetR/AcrR family transcriptional regulator
MNSPRKRLPAGVRRAQILRSAVKVFSRSNYRAATVAEVAAEAGISEALIYRFFPSKKAIFLEILQHMSERIVSLWQEEQDREENALIALRNMGTKYYSRMIEHPDELRVQFQAISEISDEAIAKRLREDHASYMRSIRRIILRGIRQGTVRPDLDVTSIVFLFDGVGILMNMLKLLAFDRQFTAARAAALMDHVIETIRADPETKVRDARRPSTRKRSRP